MANCPFCSDVLLRHIRAGRAYWLCRHCRTEILEKEFEQTLLLKKAQRATTESTVSATGKPQSAAKFDDLAIRISQPS